MLFTACMSRTQFIRNEHFYQTAMISKLLIRLISCNIDHTNLYNNFISNSILICNSFFQSLVSGLFESKQIPEHFMATANPVEPSSVGYLDNRAVSTAYVVTNHVTTFI